jgi:hypothetical protein
LGTLNESEAPFLAAWTAEQQAACFVVQEQIDSRSHSTTNSAMGFNRRKLEDQRREAAEKEAATRRATDMPSA